MKFGRTGAKIQQFLLPTVPNMIQINFSMRSFVELENLFRMTYDLFYMIENSIRKVRLYEIFSNPSGTPCTQSIQFISWEISLDKNMK